MIFIFQGRTHSFEIQQSYKQAHGIEIVIRRLTNKYKSMLLGIYSQLKIDRNKRENILENLNLGTKMMTKNVFYQVYLKD